MNRTATIIVAVFALIALGYVAFTMTQDADEIQNNNVDQTEDVNNNQEDTEVDEGEAEDEQAAQVDSVDVYVVELEAGEIGCGDAVVPIERSIEPTSGVLVAALNELLTLPDDEFGTEEQYYNALEDASLEVESATVEDGLATVNLEGELALGGTCDTPRAEEQLVQTAVQFDTVSEVEIFVNGTPLEDLLSQQGA